MTQMTGSAELIALVQTALMLPIMRSSLAARAIADMYDCRIVGLAALSVALAGATALSVLAHLGFVTPITLLAFCFIVGSGTALFGRLGKRPSATKCLRKRCRLPLRSRRSATTSLGASVPRWAVSS
jgi:hypothetical protein